MKFTIILIASLVYIALIVMSALYSWLPMGLIFIALILLPSIIYWSLVSTAPRKRKKTTQMSLEEAYRVLGLDFGASPWEIQDAHRKLIIKNHPDHGGSKHLAQMINEAKNILIRE